MTSANCTLILPNSVRPDITTDISDLSVYGVTIYNNIREITKSDITRSKNVILVGRVTLDSLSDLQLYKSEFDLNVYFISTDELMCLIMSSYAKVFMLDYSVIDHDMIMSVLYDDRASMDKYKVDDFKVSLESQDYAERLKGDSDKSISTLANDFLLLRENYLKSKDNERLLKDEIEKISSNLVGLYATNNALMNENIRLIKQYTEHYEMLKDYKVFFTEDVYDSVNLGSYKQRPKVIYFKEYSEFLHLNSFIETISCLISNQLSSSFKVVRLHDSCDIHRIRINRNKYFCVEGKFLRSDVINNDFIMCYGNYLKLFDTILTSNLDYLIVIDCKKFDNVVLRGDYLKLNLCRSSKDLEKLGLEETNTIVNNSPKSIFSWDTYDLYNKFENDLDRAIYLTSRPVMKKLYQLICDIV